MLVPIYAYYVLCSCMIKTSTCNGFIANFAKLLSKFYYQCFGDKIYCEMALLYILQCFMFGVSVLPTFLCYQSLTTIRVHDEMLRRIGAESMCERGKIVTIRAPITFSYPINNLINIIIPHHNPCASVCMLRVAYSHYDTNTKVISKFLILNL